MPLDSDGDRVVVERHIFLKDDDDICGERMRQPNDHHKMIRGIFGGKISPNQFHDII